ncbi:prepilin-type N-terminal cleavage/methylation domain-containing protein [Pseudidiomarina sp. 1APR75-33.1]|uniref:prepilin-type N-terminal cleavage/methylation domain-containing protein n=1 Tax=Pseudidiomarina terrestris TaxID=2820060 RepID=UPI00264C143A|nr:prepilin-type N-terminal cleavage/methylation domain-containing protein [Pseudidiomarina sp. 1APR75-33.1]MDN7126280.1 prepilin-type N-terminal cleavage/methylation domain-containing protein [Pseudidiomarina sp. 1APR75-33.1]
MNKLINVKKWQGFSVIELIVVIIILGIMAVTAAPVFLSDDNVDENLLRTELVSLLRLSQERAMQDVSNRCYGLTLSNTAITPVECGASINSERIISVPAGVSVTVSSTLPAAAAGILFNSWGCPVSSQHSSIAEPCGQSSVEFSIAGVDTRYVCVQSHGYIRTGACS